MHSTNFKEGKNPRIIQGEIYTDKDIPPFMSMEEWNKKHNLGDKKWIQEFVNKRSNVIMEQEEARMKDYTDPVTGKTYSEPDWSKIPYFNDADEFRNYYMTNVNPDYNWKNITHWGPQHQNALMDSLKKKVDDSQFHPPIPLEQDFGPTGTGHHSILQPTDHLVHIDHEPPEIRKGYLPIEDLHTQLVAPAVTTMTHQTHPLHNVEHWTKDETGNLVPADFSLDTKPEPPTFWDWLKGDYKEKADAYLPALIAWEQRQPEHIVRGEDGSPIPFKVGDETVRYSGGDADVSDAGIRDYGPQINPDDVYVKPTEPNVMKSKEFANLINKESIQPKNKRITEMKKYVKRRINEMVEDELTDNKLGNGRMISGEPKDIEYKEGMEVQDINPNCPHRDSRGVVIKVSNGEVTYKVTNWGRHFQPGDELTKSEDQLIPLSSEDKPWYTAGE